MMIVLITNDDVVLAIILVETRVLEWFVFGSLLCLLVETRNLTGEKNLKIEHNVLPTMRSQYVSKSKMRKLLNDIIIDCSHAIFTPKQTYSQMELE